MYGQIVHVRNACNDRSEAIRDGAVAFSDSQLVTRQTRSDRGGGMFCDLSKTIIQMEQRFLSQIRTSLWFRPIVRAMDRFPICAGLVLLRFR
jgi:hypothetical protein